MFWNFHIKPNSLEIQEKAKWLENFCDFDRASMYIAKFMTTQREEKKCSTVEQMRANPTRKT